MNDGFSGSALAALVAKYGATAAFGMIGTAILYVVLPPVDKNGRFSRTEFAIRLAVAGLFSIFFGDMLADVLMHFAPWLQPWKHKSAVDLMAGAPGWWISRALAIAMHKRRNTDILDVAKEVKELV